jgi:sterol desaturase/sphingolipid hydroxylase (fatty acid hydroxylase superfamily)
VTRDFGRGTPPGRAPVQGEATNDRRGYRPPGHVAWDEHVLAWKEYHRHHHEQDAGRIAERGGFGFWEMADLLGHEPRTWRAR